MADYTDEEIDQINYQQGKNRGYAGIDVMFNTDTAKVGRATLRKQLQQKAEQDAANAALNQQKATELGLQNDFMKEAVDIHAQEIRNIKQRDFQNQTYQFIQAASKDGSYTEAFNSLVNRNPEIATAMQNDMNVRSVYNMNPHDDRHVSAYRKAGMPPEILEQLSTTKYEIGHAKFMAKQTGEPLSDAIIAKERDMNAIAMAYPIVEDMRGGLRVEQLGDFIGSTGILKGLYSAKDKEELLKHVEAGQLALQGISQAAYSSKLAKEKAEKEKLLAEAGETGQKAEGLKLDNAIKNMMLNSGGAINYEEVLKITQPKVYMEVQKAKADLEKSSIDLQVAKQNLIKVGVETEGKRLEVLDKKETKQEKILDKQLQVGNLDVGIQQVSNIINTLDKNFDSATGKLLTSYFPDSEAAVLKKNLATIDAKGFLASIPQMKGAGALSDAEGKKLSAAITNLDIDQKTPELRKNLGIIKQYFEASKRRAKQGIKVADNAGDVIGTAQQTQSNTKPSSKQVKIIDGTLRTPGDIVNTPAGTKYVVQPNGDLKQLK